MSKTDKLHWTDSGDIELNLNMEHYLNIGIFLWVLIQWLSDDKCYLLMNVEVIVCIYGKLGCRSVAFTSYIYLIAFNSNNDINNNNNSGDLVFYLSL